MKNQSNPFSQRVPREVNMADRPFDPRPACAEVEHLYGCPVYARELRENPPLKAKGGNHMSRPRKSNQFVPATNQ